MFDVLSPDTILQVGDDLPVADIGRIYNRSVLLEAIESTELQFILWRAEVSTSLESSRDYSSLLRP